MAKRKENETIRPILEAWEPPDEVGEAIGCVATTFTFDPGFFEEHCLSRFLRLETDPREDGAAYLIEREEKLAVANVSVLVDRSNMEGSASPRWTVLPVSIPQGIFHPKISVLAWHNCIRVTIGSANLTEPAYRKNHEIFGVLDFRENGDAPVTVLVETLAFLEQLLTLVTGSDISPGPKSRARSFIAHLRSKVEGWSEVSQKRTDWPKVVPIFLGPFDQLSGAIPQRLGRLIRERGGPANGVNILSPFFDRTTEENYPATEMIIDAMTERGSREVNFCVAAEALPDNRIRLQAPASITRHGRKAADIKIYPIYEQEEHELRPLHAKSIWLWNDRWHVYMIGSSNFTRSGLGLLSNGGNVEANLAYIFPEDGKLVKSMEATLPPWDEFVRKWDEVIWEPIGEAEGEDSTAKAVLPLGFEEAIFEPGEIGGMLKITLGAKLPSWWEISTAGTSMRIYGISDHQPGPSCIELPWTAKHIPAALEVHWQSTSGAQLSAVWPVNVADMSLLPPPDALRHLSLETLIAILGSRLPLHEAVALAMKKLIWAENLTSRPTDAELDPLRRYGSETFLLQRTRKVAKAIEQLMENLSRPVFHKESLLWRLRGPVGPLALARALREAARSLGETAFLLLDLYLAFRRLDATKVSIGITETEATVELDAVKNEIRRAVLDVLESNDIPVSMHDYVSSVMRETP
jgi:HKD family nuclease